jgi:hypothetical protein
MDTDCSHFKNNAGNRLFPCLPSHEFSLIPSLSKIVIIPARFQFLDINFFMASVLLIIIIKFSLCSKEVSKCPEKMEPDRPDRVPEQAGAESRAAVVNAGAAVLAPARAAAVSVRTAAKKRRISWELPVLT